MSRLFAFVAGIVFALGLGISSMVQPAKVLAFLDVAGRWDPSLALVMGSAVGVYAVTVRIAKRMGRPVFEPQFLLPEATKVDRMLVIGAVIFGVGWGLAGYCPGPAIVSLSFASPSAWLFVPAMVVGMAIARIILNRKAARATATTTATSPAE